MIIRKTLMSDLCEVCEIYSSARDYMISRGNASQWKNGHPERELIVRDVEAGKSYVCVRDCVVYAVFYFAVECEPAYGIIDGSWLNDDSYGVVHRIARNRNSSGTGAAAHCLNWCFEQCGNIRIDTHRDNAPMRVLMASLGFAYCGTVRIDSGEERLAYQKIRLIA